MYNVHVIKSLIIVILVVVLGAGAFLSRPKPADFRPFIKKRLEQNTGSFERIWLDAKTDSFIRDCTISDRYLWVDVKKDGKTIYTGAFNHWFGDGETRSTK